MSQDLNWYNLLEFHVFVTSLPYCDLVVTRQLYVAKEALGKLPLVPKSLATFLHALVGIRISAMVRNSEHKDRIQPTSVGDMYSYFEQVLRGVWWPTKMATYSWSRRPPIFGQDGHLLLVKTATYFWSRRPPTHGQDGHLLLVKTATHPQNRIAGKMLLKKVWEKEDHKQILPPKHLYPAAKMIIRDRALMQNAMLCSDVLTGHLHVFYNVLNWIPLSPLFNITTTQIPCRYVLHSIFHIHAKSLLYPKPLIQNMHYLVMSLLQLWVAQMI